jgi:CubicO group peptidase (beta-lactamase class C family)
LERYIFASSKENNRITSKNHVMFNKPFLSATLALLTLLLLAPGCEKDVFNGPGDILSPGKVFDIDLFMENIKDGVGHEWAGYALAISQNGQLKRDAVFGKRIVPMDGNIDFEIDSPVYGASVNKVMTAVAMLKILEEKGNGDAGFWLNASIAQFLPPGWSFGPNAADITFRNLLQHRSGIASNAPIDYKGLRTLIATGTSANKNYAYSNANYGLLRILVSRMSGNAATNDNNDDNNASAVLSGFRRYMENELFKPLDIKIDTKPFGAAPALYYRWGSLANGWPMGDMTNRLGNGGFYFSAIGAAKFLSYLNHSEDIISKNTRDLMYNQFLGWSDGNNPQNEPKGEYGTYYYKGGSFCNAVTDNGGCLGQGVRNIVVTYPHNKVEVVFMANSRGGAMDSSDNLRATMRNAYDNAWVKK